MADLSTPEGKAWWMSRWPQEHTPGPHLPLHSGLAACFLPGRFCNRNNSYSLAKSSSPTSLV